MSIISITTDSNSVQVLKNIDFLLRTHQFKTILITADYPEESHADMAMSIAKDLRCIYGSKIYLLDLRTEAKKHHLDFEMNDPTKANIYLDELTKHNDYVFIIHNVHKNIHTTELPEFNIDAALLVRSKKSIGINKSRYITNLLNDADISILGLVEGRL